ncbi:MAG: MBL fold metallo-hydrolase [Clostridia bacterium]|nr:MBL fold metallo-hydrolase [Clostridia bacterium]
MARLCTLASGSSGNATYISTNDGDILVDAGVSCKALIKAISEANGDISRLKAVAVTHTHTDHICGLKTFLKTTKIPLIASNTTLETLAQGDIIPEGVKIIVADQGIITLGDMQLDFFATSHDAKGSGGYVVTLPDGRRAAVCTDLGVMTDDIRKKLYGCEALLIESNHDVEMLRRGPYPAQLKLRILSDEGHLSNNACAVELPDLVKSGTSRIVLGHISRENNTPFLAESAATATLAQIGAKKDEDYILQTAKPKIVGVTVF